MDHNGVLSGLSDAENGAVTLAVKLGYHGAAFSGFARQPGQLTVQGNLEDALAIFFAHPVETTCAGRTDAGVHARGQVVSFDVSEADLEGRDMHRVMRALQALTHPDIVVYGAYRMPAGFSARFDARSRTYKYFISFGETPPLFMRDYSWHCLKPLDEQAMYDASRCLIGEHDFKSFCKTSSAEGKPTCRFVSEIEFSHEQVMGEDLLCIQITGNAFLHSMVRSIVGTLACVGNGLRPVSWVSQALAACDRRAAGETAPAQGLVLWSVQYEGGII